MPSTLFDDLAATRQWLKEDGKMGHLRKDEIELLLDINFPVVEIPTNRTRSPQRAPGSSPQTEPQGAVRVPPGVILRNALIHHQKNLGRNKGDHNPRRVNMNARWHVTHRYTWIFAAQENSTNSKKSPFLVKVGQVHLHVGTIALTEFQLHLSCLGNDGHGLVDTNKKNGHGSKIWSRKTGEIYQTNACLACIMPLCTCLDWPIPNSNNIYWSSPFQLVISSVFIAQLSILLLIKSTCLVSIPILEHSFYIPTLGWHLQPFLLSKSLPLLNQQQQIGEHQINSL